MTAGPGLIRVLDNGEYFEVTPPVVDAVDPVGSGDAFVAGNNCWIAIWFRFESGNHSRQ